MLNSNDSFLIANTREVVYDASSELYALETLSLNALFDLAKKCFLKSVMIKNEVVGRITTVYISCEKESDKLYFALYGNIEFSRYVKSDAHTLHLSYQVGSFYLAEDGPTVKNQIDVVVIDGIKSIDNITIDGIILE